MERVKVSWFDWYIQLELSLLNEEGLGNVD